MRIARSWKTWISMVAVAVLTTAFVAHRPASPPHEIMVWKSPSCGCCGAWVTYMREHGFKVTVVDMNDVSPVKRQHQVPENLWSCHTAVVDGYVIEGHVPTVALKRFLNDKPSAIGLAVPGMPVGSPGMEGGSAEPYDVVMFGPAGRRTYMRFLGDRAL